MTSTMDPLFYGNTDVSGEYTIDNIPPGVYAIIAKARGKKAKNGNSFVIVPSVVIKRNFKLEDDVGAGAIIAGAIVGGVVGGLVGLVGIVVGLYFAGQLIATAITNSTGQYVFAGLVPGLYVVAAGGIGYKPQTFDVQIDTPDEVHNEEDKELDRDPNAAGTVSGVILNHDNIPIDRADVILYKKEDKDLIPVDYTKTNKNGVYLFNNVVVGEYLIKANEFEKIIVQTPLSPYFKKFTIGFLDLSNIKFSLNPTKKDILSNARLALNDTFVSNLGGFNKGVLTQTINVDKSGTYTLGIECLSGDTSTTLYIQYLNEDVFETKYIKVSKTNSCNEKDAKMYYINIDLKQGSNTITFSNLKGDNAPWIGRITISKDAINKIYLSHDVKLFNGAKLENNLIANVAQRKGYILLNVDVPKSQTYMFEIEYISNDITDCNIDINGISTGKVYQFEITKSLNSKNILSKVINIDLKEGNNKIKIYNK